MYTLWRALFKIYMYNIYSFYITSTHLFMGIYLLIFIVSYSHFLFFALGVGWGGVWGCGAGNIFTHFYCVLFS